VAQRTPEKVFFAFAPPLARCEGLAQGRQSHQGRDRHCALGRGFDTLLSNRTNQLLVNLKANALSFLVQPNCTITLLHSLLNDLGAAEGVALEIRPEAQKLGDCNIAIMVLPRRRILGVESLVKMFQNPRSSRCRGTLALLLLLTALTLGTLLFGLPALTFSLSQVFVHCCMLLGALLAALQLVLTLLSLIWN
jgi:hypothetical protein